MMTIPQTARAFDEESDGTSSGLIGLKLIDGNLPENQQGNNGW